MFAFIRKDFVGEVWEIKYRDGKIGTVLLYSNTEQDGLHAGFTPLQVLDAIDESCAEPRVESVRLLSEQCPVVEVCDSTPKETPKKDE